MTHPLNIHPPTNVLTVLNYIAGLFFLGFSTSVIASECKDGIHLTNSIAGIPITSYADHMEDESRQITINNILFDKDTGNFTPLKGKSPNFGLTSSAHWLRFDICRVRAQKSDIYIEILNPFVDYFDIYVVKDTNIIMHKSVTSEMTFNEREVKFRRFLLPLNIDPHGPLQVFVKMMPTGRSLIDFSLRIWTSDQLIQHNQAENIIWGIFYGGMLLMMLYNLFIYITINDNAYLYYVAYLFAFMLVWVSISGHGHEYFWPGNLFLKWYSVVIFSGFAVIFSTLFSRRFLGTYQSGGLNDKIILACGTIGVLLLVTTLVRFVASSIEIVNGSIVVITFFMWNISLVPFLYLFVGYRVFRAGFRPARYYLFAWCFLLLGTIIFSMLRSGLVSFSIITEMAGPAGALLEATFLSFALADRIRLLQQEKTEAQSKLMQAQIEPHFLFNTLANISSLIETNVTRAKQMLGKLDTYLRTTLDRTRKGETSLGQEIELLEAYLSIIQIRMGERLKYKIYVADDLKSLSLPPLLLQPLVENSIRHGLEPKTEGGMLSITGKLVGDRLILEVKDTGIGLSDGWLAGTGLSNVRDRMNMLYGRNGKLEIMEHIDGGVISRLLIPTNNKLTDTLDHG